jgi:transketolase
VLSQRKPTPMKILGIPDEETYNGASPEVFAHYWLTGGGIAGTIQTILQSLRRQKG